MAQFSTGKTWVSGNTVTAADLNLMINDAELLAGAVTEQSLNSSPAVADQFIIVTAAGQLYRTTLSALASSSAVFNASKLQSKDIPSETPEDGELLAYDTASGAWVHVAPEAATPLTPAGGIMQYGGSAAPSGWLLCDGSVKNSDTDTTLAALYTAIGFTYGGTGSDAFNLPDLQGNVPVGKAASGTFDTLNNSGGTETHPLTESEMPAHSHTLSLPIVLDYATTEQVAWYKSTHVHDYYGNPSNLAKGTSTVGSGDPHTNLPPYLVVNYIIKT